MTIRTVFRVQCDGPCKGWLSLPNDHAPGADVRHEDLTTEPTAILAANWPGERAARTAARNAGWTVLLTVPMKLRCPECTENPLGVYLPPPDGRICVDPRCPFGRAHYGPCPGPHRSDEPDPDTECVCTHPFHAHNPQGLCVKIPGVTGCGCLGFVDRWRYRG